MTDSQWFEVSGAYGRDYKSAKAANADWLAGLDFRDNTTGQYLSIRDFSEGMNVIIRYNGGLKVTNAKRLPKGVELPTPITNTELTKADAVELVEELGIDPVVLAGKFESPIQLSGVMSEYSDEEIDSTVAFERDYEGDSITTDEIMDLLKPVDRPYITHICNTAEYLLRNLSNETELIGEDGKLYSFEEFEGAVIQDSYELFPVHTIHCDQCDALRIVWMNHQFLKSMETIHLMKRGARLEYRTKLESLRLAISYELEIARDMDGK